MNPDCDLQPLKWILAIKRSPTATPPVRYRSRLVSASHQTTLRHSLNGTASTVALSTLRILLALAPTWNSSLKNSKDSIAIRVREFTKAYLQSQPTKRLIYCQPPKEYYAEFPDKSDYVWQAITQMYGEVEAGKYWIKTFVPWLCQNMLDYQQSIYDPSLLFSPTISAATTLCTDDALTVIPESKIDEESKMTTRFQCREAQKPPTDFKGMDIIQENDDVIISQTSYVANVKIGTELSASTKEELNRAMDSEEVSMLRSDAGKLAWIATGTSPIAAFQASVSLQRHKENQAIKDPRLQVLKHTRTMISYIKENNLAQLRYIPLDNDTIHLRLYSDGSFQNLETKHSQIGFIIGLADKDDKFNLVHWHSSKAPRRAHSTEESELMALDVAFRSLENLKHIYFQLMKRETPIVAYIDCEVLWKNLMKETATCIPEICYRVRETINLGHVASICLISGNLNPADAMTKQKPNAMLKKAT